VSVAEPDPEALEAEIVTENVPVTVGFPEMSPEVVLTDMPAGSPTAL
jgi:hypothetical protein